MTACEYQNIGYVYMYMYMYIQCINFYVQS